MWKQRACIDDSVIPYSNDSKIITTKNVTNCMCFCMYEDKNLNNDKRYVQPKSRPVNCEYTEVF